MALGAAAHCAKQCIQILGGIGFTWEHDAHFYLKRAMANLQLVAGGDVGALEHEVAGLAIAGARRNLAADLPAEAESLRDEIRAVVAEVAAAERRRPARRLRRGGADHAALAGAVGPGCLAARAARHRRGAGGRRRRCAPTSPWGPGRCPPSSRTAPPSSRSAGCGPTLHGQLNWCQLFSEPGAGSDLAALSTRAERVEGGWVLNGQKVWTSLAQMADFGICLARSDPDAAKHAGITYFIVDMHAEGLDIRPLRELTGAAMFNEVFFNDVFVPDDAVVGAPGDGWRIGRTTLANERVSMSSGASFGNGVESLIRTVARRSERGEPSPASLEDRLGHLIAEAQSIALLGHRSTLRTLSGVDPGSGIERAQAARRGTRAAGAGDGDGALRRRRRRARRQGAALGGGLPLHPLPHHRRRAPARCSAT